MVKIILEEARKTAQLNCDNAILAIELMENAKAKSMKQKDVAKYVWVTSETIYKIWKWQCPSNWVAKKIIQANYDGKFNK